MTVFSEGLHVAVAPSKVATFMVKVVPLKPPSTNVRTSSMLPVVLPVWPMYTFVACAKGVKGDAIVATVGGLPPVFPCTETALVNVCT